MGFCVFLFSVVTGLVIGIIADHQIYKNKGKLTGRPLAILGIGLGLIAIIHMLMPSAPPRSAHRIICGSNLAGLGKALKVYANDGRLTMYPRADKWCDLLIRADYVTEKQFKCPKDKQGPCSYAMNKHVVELGMGMATPTDLVLLFESKPGWNQVGGPEILTTENHNGKGCNVLFNDGTVEFVKTDLLDKLKWK